MKKRLLVILLSFILCPAFSSETSEEEVIGDLLLRIQQYNTRSPDLRIFLHTDREEFKAGESLFFQGYALDFSHSSPLVGADTVLVVLADRNAGMISQGLFPLDRGVFSGTLRIPDETPEGIFRIFAFTRSFLGTVPDKMFIKSIRISQNPALSLSVTPGLDSGENHDFSYALRVREGDHPASGVEIVYRAFSREGSLKGSAITDAKGNATLRIALPKEEDTEWLLKIEAQKKKSYGHLYLPIRYNPSWIKASFVPEGGVLVQGCTNRITGVVTDLTGNLVSVSAQIRSSFGDTISIPVGEDGIFRADLTPRAGTSYQIQVLLPGGKSAAIRLPEVRKEGVALRMSSPMQEEIAFDLIKSSHFQEEKAVLAGYRKGQLVYSESVSLHEPTLTIPRELFQDSGVIHFGLFDMDGNLLSERPVYVPAEMPPRWIQEACFVGTKKEKHTRNKAQQKPDVDLFLPLAYSISVSSRDSESPGMTEFMDLHAELPFPLQTLLFSSEIPTPEQSTLQDLLMCSSLFSWKELLSAPFDSFPADSKTPSFHLVWISKVKPFLLQYSETPDQAFLSPEMTETDGFELLSRPVHPQARFSNLLDLLKSIRFFSVIDDQIVFPGGHNSLYAQEGALIVIDGVQKGRDLSILNTLSPFDVSDIEISTKPQDIQKYTGLNSIGVIEIWTVNNYNQRRLRSAEDLVAPSSLVVRPGKGTFYWDAGFCCQPADWGWDLRLPKTKRLKNPQIRIEILDAKGNVYSVKKSLSR